uniref:hypothetical protein n=1 Tax=Elioraea rosea TaxID=2492390 RepID=UPI00194DD851
PRQVARVAPPPPPPAPQAGPAFPGRGATVRVLTREIPLPAGPWREAARWVDQSDPTLGVGFRQLFPVHNVILVQEKDGRPIAAIRVMATDNGGEITGWSAPLSCRPEGSSARGFVSTAGLYLDCWQVRRREAAQTAFTRQLPGAALVSSLHAVGDSRNMMEVEYAFATVPPERLAAWAPAAQAALQRGYQGSLGEGLPSP